MYFLLEGFVVKEGRRVPTGTIVVAVQQLAGAITRMLERDASIVQVSPTTEEVFIQFYQGRRKRA